MKSFAIQTENRIASLALGGSMILPLAETASRKFLGTTIPGSGVIASALTLWLGLLGAAIAARDGKLLTLATGEFLPKGRISAVALGGKWSLSDAKVKQAGLTQYKKVGKGQYERTVGTGGPEHIIRK